MVFGFILGELFGISFREIFASPIDNALFYLGLSVLIGFIHISIGILLRLIFNLNGIKIVLHSLASLLIIGSLVSLYFYHDILLNKALLTIGILLLFAVHKFEALENILSLVISALSYMRISAIGLGHIIISKLLVSQYQNLSSSAIGIFMFALIFLIGFSIVLTLGLLITILQDVRLYWIEFLPKFLIGKGIKFSPFKHVY